jgi:hypothetical protein
MFARGRVTPLADAGALDDPLVARVEERRELVVAEDTLREVAPGAADYYVISHCATL